MDNFDLKKFLTENRLTSNTQNSRRSPVSNDTVVNEEERFQDFLKGHTITFRYAGFEEVPGTEGGGYVTYTSTQPIGRSTVVLELGGQVTKDSMGYLVDFEYVFDYDENLKIDIV